MTHLRILIPSTFKNFTVSILYSVYNEYRELFIDCIDIATSNTCIKGGYGIARRLCANILETTKKVGKLVNTSHRSFKC